MDVSKLYEKAEEAIKRKNYDYAVDILMKQILPIYPNDVKARKLLRGTVIKKYDENGYPGKLAQMKAAGARAMLEKHKMTKQWDKAMEECEKCLLLAPKDVAILFSLAECSKQGGHAETAIAMLENAVQIDPEHKKSLKLLGHLYREKEDFEKAQGYFQKASKLDPTDNEAKKAVKDLAAMRTGRDYGQAKSSRDVIRDQSAADKMEAEHHILRTPEEIRAAIERTKADYAVDNKNKKVLRRLGELHMRMEEYDKAIEWFEKGIAVDPTSFDIRKLIGDCKIAKLEIPVRQTRKELEKSPADAAVQKKLDDLQAKKSKFEIEEYKARVTEHPTDLELRYFYGKALYDANQLEDAIAEFQKSCKDPRYKMESFNHMGQAFLQQGDPELAIKQFQRALEDVTGMGEKAKLLRYNLGKAYQSANDSAHALDQFQMILEADVRYKDVRERIRQVKGGQSGAKQ
ncbi:MAG: tetratricopeptide repeat protein [Planctomycetes bacterium]|nr:tetratricopeptide repeat protein [Planctomycetota bacterium]